MKIKLDLFEIVALQTILKNPGGIIRFSFTDDLITYGLVEFFQAGYKITEGGKLVLGNHMPYLNNGQNMKQPLGLKMSPKPKR